MSPDYKSDKTDELEEVGVRLLNELGYSAERNNLEIQTKPDYVLEDGRLFDFQFSDKFGKYGDLRIDLVSAYSNHHEPTRLQLQRQIKDGLSSPISKMGFRDYISQFLDVQKWGKYFENDNISAVLYFMYNDSYNSGKVPDKILLISRDSVLDYFEKHWKNLLSRGFLKLNKKDHLGDFHGSAFVPVSYSDLAETYTTEISLRSNVFESKVDISLDTKLRLGQ